MAKVIIVDKEDQIVGSKERDEVGPGDIERVTALWLTNSKGEVLLAQRSLAKKNSPGKWGPAVAGTVEEGETYESNIIKEAKEEIGLINFDFNLGPKFYVESSHNYFVQFFLATADHALEYFQIQKEEVEQLRWIPKTNLLSDFQKHPELYVPAMKYYISLFE